MTILQALIRRLTMLVLKRQIERDLEKEMALHVDLRAARNTEAGMPPRDAARRARLDFGSSLQLREQSRDAWGWTWIDGAARDLRSAIRGLRRSPGFSTMAVLSLALGFALTGIASSVTKAYLITPLPYPAADRVFHVAYAPPGPWEPRNLSALDWSTMNDAVEFPLLSSAETFYLADGARRALRGRRVNYGMLAGLDVRIAPGRPLTENDFSPNADPSALIGYTVWRDRFGADPAIAGRSVVLENAAGRSETVRIAGVLPRGFYIGGDSVRPIEVVVPITQPPRTYYLLRLRDGVAPRVVEQRLTAAVREVSTGIPPDWTGVHLESAHVRYTGELRPVLTGVTLASLFVLVIAAANVGVLMVLRTAHRQREIAVRLAMGVDRTGLVRLLTAEAALLAAGSVALGLALASIGLRVLAPRLAVELGRSAPGGAATMTLDATMLLVMMAAAALVTVLLAGFSVVVVRGHWLAEIGRQARGGIADGRTARALRSFTLASELGITLVLLVGGGLLTRSVVAMRQVDLGFDPDHVSRARIALRADDDADAAAYTRFYQTFTRTASARLGTSVVFSSWPTLVEFPEQTVEAEGGAAAVPRVGAVEVGAGYFSTLGIGVRRGRDVTSDDVRSAEPVAIVSESLASKLWPGESALGRRVRRIEVTAGGSRPPGPWQVVVGVVSDVRQSYRDTNLNDVYTSWLPDGRFASFHVRAPASASIAAALDDVTREIDPHASLDLFHAVNDDNRELAGTVFLSLMLTGFALIAALIAVVGVYAVTAYAVQQRGKEVIIRVALGARPGTVVRLFLAGGAPAVACGLTAGLAGAIVVTRLLEHSVFGIVSFDGSTIVGMSCALGLACLAATCWPARRAAARGPLGALRES